MTCSVLSRLYIFPVMFTVISKQSFNYYCFLWTKNLRQEGVSEFVRDKPPCKSVLTHGFAARGWSTAVIYEDILIVKYVLGQLMFVQEGEVCIFPDLQQVVMCLSCTVL